MIEAAATETGLPNALPSGPSNIGRRGFVARWFADVVGVLWVLAAGVAVLTPALVRGAYLGPYQYLLASGLTSHAGVTAAGVYGSDRIQLFIPWSSLAWNQVHHLELPLWNPYSALGMPLAFNWESAPFSLPALVSYAFPAPLVYTVQVMVTLAIAGIGAYVLARVLRLGVFACVMVAVVYELSGPFIDLLGWSAAAVMSWGPWLFTASLLIVRGQRRLRSVVFFAVAVAFTIYAGEPEIMFLLGLSLVVFLVVLLALRTHDGWGIRRIQRPIIDLLIATAAGVGLAAPLILPGLQVATLSIRSASPNAYGAVFHHASSWTSILGPPFQRDPIGMGLIAGLLAIIAVFVRWRDPEVLAFTGVALFMGGVGFAGPVVWLMKHVPKLGGILWGDAIMPMSLAIAVLAGIGTNELARSYQRRTERTWLLVVFVASAIVLVALWASERSQVSSLFPTTDTKTTYLWPVLQTALGIVLVTSMTVVRRSARFRTRMRALAVSAFVACETAFLVPVGIPLWSSNKTFLPSNRAVVALKHVVGSSVVTSGYGFPLLPNANVAYGVHQLAVYDPMTPLAYFRSWRAVTGESGGLPSHSEFYPTVRSAAVARRFGIGFILEPIASPGPSGSDYVSTIKGEVLYRIPGAAAATLTPLRAGGASPLPDAFGTPVSVSYPDSASWRLTTNATGGQVLRLHLTDLPGWHGTIDGRPLPLGRYSGIMLQARIPSGHHTVELHYWPTAFTVGIILALCSAGGLALTVVMSIFRRPNSSLRLPPLNE